MDSVASENSFASTPDVRKRLEGAGMDVFIRDSKSMMTLIRADFEKYSKAAKAANIRAE